MRMSEKSEDLTGKICVCSMGRLAIVTGETTMPWGPTWGGVGLDGHGLWYNREPVVIAESIEEYHMMLEKISL